MLGKKRIPLQHRASFNTAFLLEHYFPRSERIRRWKRGARMRVAEHLLRSGEGSVVPVERVERLSPPEFRERYLARGVPVILSKAAAGWPAATRWSFERFRARYGHETIKLVQRKGVAAEEELNTEREYSEEIGFEAFLDQLLSGGTKYMRFSPLLEKFPELLDDLDHGFFRRMVGNGWGMTFQLFMGGAGTFTPLHDAMTPFFFVNLCGVKRWGLVANHYLAVLDPSADGFGYNHSAAHIDLSNAELFPGLREADRMEAVMQPGDILFLPSWMWHCVKNDSPTIGVRCGFIHPKTMLTEAFTLSFVRLFAARNPSTLEALYYALFRRDLPERDKWLLTAKLIRR